MLSTKAAERNATWMRATSSTKALWAGTEHSLRAMGNPAEGTLRQ